MNLTQLWTRFREGHSLVGGIAEAAPTFLRRHHRAELVNHVAQVALNAGQIAARFGAPTEAAVTAAWLHDISLVLPVVDMAETTHALGITVLQEEAKAPFLLHGKLSAAFASNLFGVSDSTVLQAISCHTTLRANSALLDRVLFVADKLSWDPVQAPYHADLTTALSHSLDDAVRLFLKWSWQQRHTFPVLHPWLAEACAEWLVN